MSEQRRVLLAGATGMLGRAIMHAAIEHPLVQLVGLSRREVPLPLGGRMEMLLAPIEEWPAAIATIGPDSAICALGTTWQRQGGESEESLRAIDFDLVMIVAESAKAVGTTNFVLVSSAGADKFAKAPYLRVKGEVEDAVAKLRFKRLDILRPGPLRAPENDRTLLDRLFRSPGRVPNAIEIDVVATAALQLAREKAAGRFVHDNDSIRRAVRRLEGTA